MYDAGINNPPLTEDKFKFTQVRYRNQVLCLGCPEVREMWQSYEGSIFRLRQRKGTMAIKTGALRDILVLEKIN